MRRWSKWLHGQSVIIRSGYWVILFNHADTITIGFWDHFEAVRSFDGLNLDEKYIANPFLTLPRPPNGLKNWFQTDF